MPAGGCQHREREGEIRRGRDGPAFGGRMAEVDSQVNQRGQDHAADCCGHGHERRGDSAHLAGHQLALQLQARDEEEDGQQPVGGPFFQAQVQMKGRRPDREVAQVLIPAACTGVSQDEGEHGGAEQQAAADRLGAQGVGQHAQFAQRPAARNRTASRAPSGPRTRMRSSPTGGSVTRPRAPSGSGHARRGPGLVRAGITDTRSAPVPGGDGLSASGPASGCP